MKLQEKEQNQDEKHIGKLLQPKYKRYLLAQELKPQGQWFQSCQLIASDKFNLLRNTH